MSDLSLFAQLTIILGVLCFVLAIALGNQVRKRRSMVSKIIFAKNAPSAPGQEDREFKSLIESMPEWLALIINSNQYELIFGSVTTWLDYARGNLLLAMVGSILAFFGALLAASGLVLFGIVGAGVMVIGFQILYAAAQDAGIFSSVRRPPTTEKSGVSGSSKVHTSKTGAAKSEP